ncbi:DUF1501 domain-containing protein [Isosphaeraceae bacterium EP7]
MARKADGGHSGCSGFQDLGVTRRSMLKAGTLGLTGLGLPELMGGRALAAATRKAGKLKAGGADGFGQAKACILVFMWGGPSQLDTWDPKPEAPEAIRGPFKAISTSVPGVQISEHFPMLAQRMDKLTLIRSMSHNDPAHLSSAHRVLTGHLAPTPISDAAGPTPNDSPHLGSLVARMMPARGAMPASVTMPWTVAHPAAPGGRAPGQHAGWLGKAYDPFAVEGDPNNPAFKVAGLDLPDGVSPERMVGRRSLLGGLSPVESSGAWGGFQSKAIDALSSAEARGAFTLDGEDPRLRDRYGRHIHGQCLMMARRLVESGVHLVTVNWHDDGQNFWDTHGDNFDHLQNRLMPPADRAFSALLDDLEARGMLDETLVVWTGEFGRTPRINPVAGVRGGREHWPRCYTAAMAGGGVKRGSIYGASDRWAASPIQNPVSPDDVGATILHALGIDPALELFDPLGRPLRVNNGNVVRDIFA